MNSLSPNMAPARLNSEAKALESLKTSREARESGQTSSGFGSMLNSQEIVGLLLASIRCQDPMNPRDASEMGRDAMSMAQMHTLMDMRDLLKGQQETQNASQMLQASANVGRMAEVKGDRFSFDPTNPAQEIKYTLPQGVHSAQIQVLNKKGEVVHSHTLQNEKGGPLAAKQHTYTFDGKPTTPAGQHISEEGCLPAGAYTVRIAVSDQEGKPFTDPNTQKLAQISTTVQSKITGVKKGGGETVFEMGNVTYPIRSLVGLQEAKTV